MTANAAETEVISKEQQMIYFSDGSALSVDIAKDVIRITGTHVKSDNRYSYATSGFNITLEATDGMVEQRDYLPVTMLEKKETIDTEVTTCYVLDRDSVYEAVFELFWHQYAEKEEAVVKAEFLASLHENKGLDFYLHNAFQVIERTGGSGSKIISASKTYHNLGTPVGSTGRKVSGILNAIYDLYGLEWSLATQAKLPEYYDIHMKIFMEPCYANVFLVTEEGEILQQVVADYPLVQYAQMHYFLPESCYDKLVNGEKEYRLTEESIRKSYVCYGASEQRAQTYSLNTKEGLAVRLANGEVTYRQLFREDSFVYLVCEELETTQEEKPEEDIADVGQRVKIECFETAAEIELRAGVWDNPLFDVSNAGGIPVNEELCLEGSLMGYLLQAEFLCHEGEVELWIPVQKTYELHWQEITGYEEEEAVYEDFVYEKTVQTYVPVKREYSYVEIKELEYYQLELVRVENEVLPEGEVKIEKSEVIFKVPLPDVSYQQYGTFEEHVIYPAEVSSGIVLETEQIYGTDTMPMVPAEDFTAVVEEMVSQLQVRSDSFCFDKKQYLSAAFEVQTSRDIRKETEALMKLKEMQNRGILQKQQLYIPQTVLNGIHQSRAEIVYRRNVSINLRYPEEIAFQDTKVNSVFIHTPAYCDGELFTDNKQYCQMTSPAEGMEVLVLDAEGISSDFLVSISNYGYHTAKQGYEMRDYSAALSRPELSYIAKQDGRLRNEVYFPFDVFMDVGMDENRENDVFYTAGQWLTIGKETVRFYLPEWVKEGQYEVCYRTVAVNGTGYIEREEAGANTRYRNYVATDSCMVEVSGKMYAFRIYDIADYPAWQGVFRDEADEITGFVYTAGSCDEYGRRRGNAVKYTLPILSGSHPESEQQYIKPGYAFRFSIDTIGKRLSADSSYIQITPRFYHVDASGNVREEVDLYYCQRDTDGKKYLVRIGSEQDKRYVVTETVGSRWFGIPEKELQMTAQLKGVEPEKYKQQEDVLYTYSALRSRSCFRTFCNFSYAEQIDTHWQKDRIYRSGIRKENLYSLQQRHYFSYSLPHDIKAVVAGYPVESYAQEHGVNFGEKFWKKDGYLIVSFEITAYAKGEAYLDYANMENRERGYCCMWSKEKKPSEKTDGNGRLFYFEEGDIFCFPVNSSIQQDYLQGGIY